MNVRGEETEHSLSYTMVCNLLGPQISISWVPYISCDHTGKWRTLEMSCLIVFAVAGSLVGVMIDGVPVK